MAPQVLEITGSDGKCKVVADPRTIAAAGVRPKKGGGLRAYFDLDPAASDVTITRPGEAEFFVWNVAYVPPEARRPCGNSRPGPAEEDD